MKYKVGDMVKVLDANIDADLIGKILPIVRIDRECSSYYRIWVEGSKSSWGGNDTNLDDYLQLVSSHISSVSDGASCTVSTLSMDKSSVLYKNLDPDMRILLDEGVVLSDGDLSLSNKIVKEVLFEAHKKALVEKSKAVRAEHEKAAKK